jgi:pilus assembly protein CpaE
MAMVKTVDLLSVLILTDRTDSVGRLQHIFSTEKKYTVRFINSCQEALQIAAKDPPRLVVVDDLLKDCNSLDAIRRLMVLSPILPIVVLADEKAVTYVREAMLAGARAFILKPLNESEVFMTLNQLVEMETLRHDSMAGKQPSGATRRNQIITLISPKGGAGCTTLAVNLAVLLHQKTNAWVALVDGHSGLGDLETVLNLQAQFTVGDVLAQGSGMDIDLIKGMMVVHKSGIHALVSSRNVEETYGINTDNFEKMLSLINSEYDYVIVDGGSIIEEQTSVALSLADKVLLVVTPEMTALQRTLLFLKAADENDFPREKLFLVVNREGIKGGISTEDISRHLNTQVLAAIPEDSGLITYSLNRGIPLSISDPRSAVAQKIAKLASQMIPAQRPATSLDGKGLIGRLGTLFQGGTL